MMEPNANRWYFTKEQIVETPSKKCGVDSSKERYYRRLTANFLQEMGQHLRVPQLCINNSIVCMNRFYMLHSFTVFHWFNVASAAMYLSVKMLDLQRDIDSVIKVASVCMAKIKGSSIPENYIFRAADVYFHEIIILQTLGFNYSIEHPQTYILQWCTKLGASSQFSEKACHLATKTLQRSTMCLQYKPNVVACLCLYFACRWSGWKIPLSKDNHEWFHYLDPTMTKELLQSLIVDPTMTKELLQTWIVDVYPIFEKYCQSLKNKFLAIASARTLQTSASSSEPQLMESETTYST